MQVHLTWTIFLVVAVTVESAFNVREKRQTELGDTVEVFSRPEYCSLPPVTGLCRAGFRRFYYDEEAGRCKRFIYGGCGGNDNNFGSRRECRHSCTLFS